MKCFNLKEEAESLPKEEAGGPGVKVSDHWNWIRNLNASNLLSRSSKLYLASVSNCKSLLETHLRPQSRCCDCGKCIALCTRHSVGFLTAASLKDCHLWAQYASPRRDVRRRSGSCSEFLMHALHHSNPTCQRHSNADRFNAFQCVWTCVLGQPSSGVWNEWAIKMDKHRVIHYIQYQIIQNHPKYIKVYQNHHNPSGNSKVDLHRPKKELPLCFLALRESWSLGGKWDAWLEKRRISSFSNDFLSSQT